MRYFYTHRSNSVKFILLLLLFQLFCLHSCYAESMDVLNSALADGIPVIDYPRSLKETAQFEGMDMTPEDFIQATMNDHENLCHTLETYGVDSSHMASLLLGKYKRFSFFDVPISDEPFDITVLCFQNGESRIAVLFSCKKNTSRLIDIIYDVESVKLLDGLTNSWLQFTSSAFATSLSYEWLYNLSSGITETGYVTCTSFPAHDIEEDEIISVSGNALIDEHSTVENGKSIFHCYLTVVQHASLCSMNETSITEIEATTKIIIYQYDYTLKRFVYLKTNQYDDINLATADLQLGNDLLLLD